MLDGNHYATQELVQTLMTNANEQAVYNLVQTLNPELKIVDGKYKYNYKNILFGEGDTVRNALWDLWMNFNNKKLEEDKNRMIETGHPDAICQECGGKNIGWMAPNSIWSKVMPDEGGILCPECFYKKAKQKGIHIWFQAIGFK